MKEAPNARKMFWMNFCLYLLSFCEGFLTCHALVVFFFYKRTCGMPVEKVTEMDLWASFVPLINPLYGSLSDNFALFGYHRKSYLVVAGLLGIAGYAYLSTLRARDYSFALFLAIFLFMELVGQFRTVLINSYCVMAYKCNKSNEAKEDGRINKKVVSRRQSCLHAGRLLSLPILLVYPRVHSKIFLLLALCVLVIVGCALLMEEVASESSKEERRLIAQVIQCFKVIREERMGPMLLSNFVTQSAPFIETVIKSYLTDIHGFTEALYIYRSAVSRLSMMFGVYSIQTYFGNFNRSLFSKTTSLLYTLAVLVFVGMIYGQVTLRSAAIVLVMLFAALHSYFSELKKISFLSIVVEKSPPNIQAFFSTIMFYLDNTAIIISKVAALLIVWRLRMKETAYARLDVFMLAHVGVCLLGNVMLILSPIPHKKRAAGKAALDTIEPESPPELIGGAVEPLGIAMETPSNAMQILCDLEADTLFPDVGDEKTLPIAMGNLPFLPESPVNEKFRPAN